MDASERALLEQTVREALARAADTGADADRVLADLGWPEMLEAEPDDAIAVVGQALGASNARATVLDDVVAHGLGARPRPDLAVLLPPFASARPPARIDGAGLAAQGLASARAASAAQLLVVCADGDDLRLANVPLTQVTARRVQGIDPGAGFHIVEVTAGAADARPLDRAAWDTAVALGRRAVAHETAGACRTMLDLARTHALERMQFGRPIARFQAVRHRLAEALVAVEALDAALGAAAGAPGPDTAALAKALAGRAARTVAAHCQQVLGGIGFTTEHPFHCYLKRTMALEGILGSPDEIVLDAGRRLLATRQVPTLIEL